MAKPKCPKCGNENAQKFTFSDRPFAYRRVTDFEADTDTILVTASYKTEYEDGHKETERLHCDECGNVILVPCKIDHVDD